MGHTCGPEENGRKCQRERAAGSAGSSHLPAPAHERIGLVWMTWSGCMRMHAPQIDGFLRVAEERSFESATRR
jgi:hypothetical protein